MRPVICIKLFISLFSPKAIKLFYVFLCFTAIPHLHVE